MLVLTFQIGKDLVALDVRRVREVVPRVTLHQVAGAPHWLAGVFIYRGHVVPVIDLHRLIGVGECPTQLSTRIILVPQPSTPTTLISAGEKDRDEVGEEQLLGLLATQVADIRELQLPTLAQGQLTAPTWPDLGPVLVDGPEIIHLADLGRLLPESFQRQLALIPREVCA